MSSADQEALVNGYPEVVVPADGVAPVPRRLRGFLGNEREFATVHSEGPAAGTVHFEWKALDAWFEEDEQVFVHARNPYARVDALRSSRQLRVERDGVVLAEAEAIAGLVAFFDERVDTFVDGRPQQRPVTPFSERPDA